MEITKEFVEQEIQKLQQLEAQQTQALRDADANIVKIRGGIQALQMVLNALEAPLLEGVPDLQKAELTLVKPGV